MDQAHCMECVRLENLRMDLDLTNIEDMVKFFSKMLMERANIDAQKNKGSKDGDESARHDS